jgi:hypothetical protein
MGRAKVQVRLFSVLCILNCVQTITTAFIPYLILDGNVLLLHSDLTIPINNSTSDVISAPVTSFLLWCTNIKYLEPQNNQSRCVGVYTLTVILQTE